MAVTSGKVHIRAERLPEDKDQSIAAVANRTVLRQFLTDNPDIEIEPFVMPVVSEATSFDSGPVMAIAAGVPPHVMFVNFRRSSTYIARGFLEPLEPLLARVLSRNARVREADADGKWLEDPTPDEVAAALQRIKDRVAKPVWPVVYRKDDSGNTPGEHAWTIPTTNLVTALLYRKDLFYEAGLDPERPPRDWDEFLEYARKLTIPERQQYGYGVYGASMAWATYSFLASNGVRVVEQDGAGDWRAVYATPQAAEAVRYLHRLIHEPFERDGKVINGCMQVYPYRTDLPWNQGKLGMITIYVNEEMMSNIKPQLIGIAPVPHSPRGTRGSEINGEMLGVFRGCTPQQQLAAMRYIDFRTGEEAERIRTKVYVDGGYGIFVNPNLLKKFGYDRLLAQVPGQWREAFDAAMAAGVPEPYGKNSGPIWRYMAVPINDALELPLDQMTPDAAQAATLKLLETSAEDVNRKLLGVIPPEVMRTRRIVAGVVVTLVAAAFILGMAHVWRYFGRMARASGMGARRWTVGGYFLILPALALIVVWQYAPLVGGAGIAVVDYEIARPSHWVGLDNFASVLFDERFWSSLARTFYFVLLVIGLGFWPPILLAILLQEIPTATAKYAFRVIYYLPAVVSGVIVIFLWRQFYDPSDRGILNQVLMSVNRLDPVSATALKLLFLGLWVSLIVALVRLPVRVSEMSGVMKATLWIAAAAFALATVWTVSQVGVAGFVGRFDVPPLRWIYSPGMAMLCVVIPMVWAASGHASILYLAALKTVPEELYEAADIDGASHWHKVFYIVIPRLKYLIVIQFIAAVIGAFKGGTDYILALTGGGPNDATNVLALEVLIRAFFDMHFGIGAAMAWILGAMLVGFTAYQLKMLSRAEFKAGG
ncbi:MAG: extracellular solute-binding protein [Tepidisphaeraceae bacterium]